MEFRVSDIFALIHPTGSPIYDVSFMRAEGLELFWSRYELKQSLPEWRGFVAQAISRQNNVKRVTVLTSNESLSNIDIMTWLSRYGEVVQFPVKNRDEFGIWSGAWTFMVKLRYAGNTVTHIPSSTFLGRDRILVFYQGQPKLCHRCGDPTHFSAQCRAQVCALCGEVGHLAASCGRIRCHLCGDLGHPFSRCPRSAANNSASSRHMGESKGPEDVGEDMDEGKSKGEGAEEPMTRKNKTAAQLRRMEVRRKEREGVTQTHAGGSLNSRNLETTSRAGQTEALRESDIEEETRRIEEEEEAALPTASYHSGSGEGSDGGEREKQLTKRSAKRGKGRGRMGNSFPLEWDHSTPLTLGQVPDKGRLGKTPPLTETANRYGVLRTLLASSEDEVEEDDIQKGKAGGSSGSGAITPGRSQITAKDPQIPGVEGEGAGQLSGGEEQIAHKKGDNGVTMDMSISLKRVKPSTSDGEGEVSGIGKKKAVELDHQ